MDTVASSVEHFKKGVNSCGQIAAGMSLIMGDVLTGKVSVEQATVICRASGVALKSVELVHRHGQSDGTGVKDVTFPS